MGKYGSLLLGKDLRPCPNEIVEYMRLRRSAESIEYGNRLLELFMRNVDRSSQSSAHKDLLKVHNEVKRRMKLLSSKLSDARQLY